MFRSLARFSSNRLTVDSVMKSIDRLKFYKGVKEYNSNISTPYVHKFLLDLLYPKLIPGAKVLDIGTGTGYLTACMAKLTQKDGDRLNIMGIEHVKELAKIARENMKEEGITNTIIYNMDGRKSMLGAKNLFDVINVGGSVKELTPEILKQLAPGGLLVASIGKGYSDQKFYKVTKDEKTEEIIYELVTDEYVFAPLTDLRYQLSEDYLNNPFRIKI